MNTIINSPLNKSTAIKRIGLSRKRKIFGACGNSMKKNREDFSGRKITKQDVQISEREEKSEAHEVCDISEKVVNHTSGTENGLKCATGHQKDKIAELEQLYSTWRSGCKTAFLYLLEKLKKLKSEKLDDKKLLEELGILNVMSNHFINDSDLSFCICDSD